MFFLPLRMATQNVRVQLLRSRTADDLIVDSVFQARVQGFEDGYEPPITLLGQVRFQRSQDQLAGDTGDKQYTRGHVTFKIQHLVQRGVTDPERLKNARIRGLQRYHVSGGGLDTEDFRIVEVRWRGHLRGGAIIVEAFFESEMDLIGSV